jgi:hypothetical protein
MGFKTFTLFASDIPGYFGTEPAHDPTKGDDMLERLGLTGYTLIDPNVELNDYPADHDLYIGAYPHGVVISHHELPAAFFDEKSRRKNFGRTADRSDFVQRIVGLYPQGEVLALILHSVSDVWGFSLYRNGQLVRCASGGGGEFHGSIGVPLPEELSILSKHPIESIDNEGLGEELVFDVAQRVLGRRYDEEDLGELLKCSHYRMAPKARSTWSKLWTFWRTVADLPGLLFDVIFDAISRSRKIGK